MLYILGSFTDHIWTESFCVDSRVTPEWLYSLPGSGVLHVLRLAYWASVGSVFCCYRGWVNQGCLIGGRVRATMAMEWGAV